MMTGLKVETETKQINKMKIYHGSTFLFKPTSKNVIKIYNYIGQFVGSYDLKTDLFNFASSDNSKFTCKNMLELVENLKEFKSVNFFI